MEGRMVMVVKAPAWVKKGLGGVTALHRPWFLGPAVGAVVECRGQNEFYIQP